MHILEIPSFFPPLGGAFCLEQAKALKACGNEVRILACNQLGVTVNRNMFFSARFGRWEEEIEGITVVRSNMRGVPKWVKYNQRRWCSIVRNMFLDYVKRYGNPDVLHAHCCQWAGVAARIISEEHHIPYFITEHLSSGIFKGSYGNGWERNPWAKELLRETYEKADGVIHVSEELVDDLAPFFGKNYRYTPVSNIIDCDFFAFRKREERHGRPFRFCCLAVASKGFFTLKGYDTLIEAFKGMQNAELHIAGRDTDGEVMRSAVNGMNNVFLYGEVDKCGVRELLYKCDALVLASTSEVQPLVILEAMSTGIPVVATEVVPLSERIDGFCLVAQSRNADDLREKMQQSMAIAPSESLHDKVFELASPHTVAQKLCYYFAKA